MWAPGVRAQTVDGPEPAVASEGKSSDFIWIPPTVVYHDWVFLLQAYYSGLDGVGAGFEVSRPFRFPFLGDYVVDDSEFLVKARVYEQMHGEIEVTTGSGSVPRLTVTAFEATCPAKTVTVALASFRSVNRSEA